MLTERKRDARIPRARNLRRNVTDAEKKLWHHLKRLSLGSSHFRRQAAIGPYFADFACHQLGIVIEIDGGQHGAPERLQSDAARTKFLKSRGYRVLRFWNSDVLANIDGVLETIMIALNADQSAPHP